MLISIFIRIKMSVSRVVKAWKERVDLSASVSL